MDKKELAMNTYQNSPTASDCTASYAVTLSRSCTLKEFIDLVISNDREWGDIKLDEFNSWDEQAFLCEYRHGVVKKTRSDIAKYYDNEIDYVTAHGGWSLMNYYIVFKSTKEIK